MIETHGFDEAIRAIGALMDNVPEVVEAIAHRLKRVAMDETPVDTGSMQGAWVVEGVREMTFSITIDPAAVNARSGVPVTDYAGHIIARDGIFDAVRRAAPRITEQEAQRYGFLT
jgi:hypothetical protein